MLIFEMFHSPPCRLLADYGCPASEFVAQIALNVFWATLLGAVAWHRFGRNHAR
jgi:hypothetical protein